MLTPVVVTCHLCRPPADGQIVTVAGRAWWVAVDHALDVHRPEVLADHTAALAAFTVTSTGRPMPLHRRTAGSLR